MTTQGCAPQDAAQVMKSPADDRDYRYLTLDNGLKVLLVSDPDTDKGAAAVDVNVGSYNDPDDRLGLAHFLEHMLFMGTDKYPDVDGYFEFVRANGGMSNAYTTDVRTNYYFDINAEQLEPALDRLAQFFIAPKLDPNYVERERHAVDSEYKLHAKEDGWRLFVAQNATANPEHPKSRFTIGSLETLNDNDGKLWQTLKDFYKKYYVASNMSAVVYGKESLDQLEAMAKTAFAGVPAGERPDSHIGLPPFTKEQQQVRINLVPLKETRALSLNFTLPTTQPHYEKKPLGYLARILGYEGEGSLYSALKAEGLIDSLAAYSTDLPNEFSEFAIRMELTPAGLEQVDAITAQVFDYLALIRKEGISSAMFEESKKVAQLGFRFQEQGTPQNMATTLAAKMHYLPTKDLLSSAYLYNEYDEALIRQFLDELTSANLRQVVIAPELKTDTVEPYFDTAYSIEPLSAELVERLSSPQEQKAHAIPQANPFIADDVTLRDSSKHDEPVVLRDDKGLTLWHRADSSFGTPRSHVQVFISSEDAASSVQNVAMLQLYRALLSHSLNEFGYPAKEAGLNYGLVASRRGLLISLGGYQDKQALLLDAILNAVKDFDPKASVFEQERAMLVRALKNRTFQPPYRQGMDRLTQLSYVGTPSEAVLLKAMEGITFEQLQAFAKTIWRSIHVEMLVYGNHSESEAKALAASVEQALLTDDNRRSKFEGEHLLLGDSDQVMELSIDHNDSMIVSYYQMEETDNRSRGQYALLSRLFASPFFNSLRTEQQLGYVVFAGPRPFERHPGVMFVVQSPKLNAQGLEQRIATFLTEQQEALKTLTDTELDTYRQGLIGDLLRKDANLNERNNRFWTGIATGETDFNNREAIAAEIEKLTVADMQQALARLLENRGRLTIRSFGEPHQSEKVEEKTRPVYTSSKALKAALK